jgi:hypothetical protein
MRELLSVSTLARSGREKKIYRIDLTRIAKYFPFTSEEQCRHGTHNREYFLDQTSAE